VLEMAMGGGGGGPILGGGITTEKLRVSAAAHERAGWLMRRMAVALEAGDRATVTACLNELASLETGMRAVRK
jgi:hypothetical protein